ncbi:hypothetical protein, partial [Citrobacter sp. wls619]|uniref:hypothetical protein n=1 Tax=Citrobacter sp. wls619 TaxID=2576432 RepID=UPI001BAFD83F
PNRKSPDFTAHLYLLNFSAFYLRQISGQCCTVSEAIPPGTCYHINAFYFTGCGLHCRKALLPRDRKTAPESAIFRALHPTSASLSSRKATK